MERVYSAVSIVTGGLLVYIVMCSPLVAIPVFVLILFLLTLQIALIWMVLLILKSDAPSKHTFDERMYEDFQADQ